MMVPKNKLFRKLFFGLCLIDQERANYSLGQIYRKVVRGGELTEKDIKKFYRAKNLRERSRFRQLGVDIENIKGDHDNYFEFTQDLRLDEKFALSDKSYKKFLATTDLLVSLSSQKDKEYILKKCKAKGLDVDLDLLNSNNPMSKLVQRNFYR